MPRQNRVTPFGELIATPARGTFMGNRGCLHDAHGHIVRSSARPAWIICALEFKGRHRQVMAPGKYTELFFLDEATALAAGHRPCATCRREDYRHFLGLWLEVNAARLGTLPAGIAGVDKVLGRERGEPGRGRNTWRSSLARLPTGAFVVEDEGSAAMVVDGRLATWSPSGYGPLHSGRDGYEYDVLTPPSTCAALAAGYRPATAPVRG